VLFTCKFFFIAQQETDLLVILLIIKKYHVPCSWGGRNNNKWESKPTLSILLIKVRL